MKKNSKISKSHKVFSIVSFIVIGLYSISLLLPLFWALSSIFKTALEFPRNIMGLPREWTIENITGAFKILKADVETTTGTRAVYAAEMLINSLIYALGCTIVTTFAQLSVAYCVAKFKFFLKKIIYGIVIVMMLLPIVGALPSAIQMSRMVGTYDSIVGIFFMSYTFGGMHFLILYATYQGIPNDYAEAAQIDGASHFAVFFKIMIPLGMASITAVAILLFITYWNDYYTPMVYLPSMPTIAYGLFRFSVSPENSNSVPVQLTGCLMVSLPIIILFLVFKNKIMGNVMVGGLKG